MISRRALIVAPLALSACSGERPRRTSFPPLDYAYLMPLNLNVASIEEAPLPAPGPLDELDPAPPGPALLQMARDRLRPSGSLGTALFTVDTASIERSGGVLRGVFAVRLEVKTSDGLRAGFAQAEVSRRVEGIGSDLRTALYDLTAQMMGDMNVEFEFQVRQSLRDWLQATASDAPSPAAVEQQTLTAPTRPAP